MRNKLLILIKKKYLILLSVSSAIFYFDYLEAQSISKAFEYLVNSQHEYGYWKHRNVENTSFEALYTLKLFDTATNTYSRGKKWYDDLVYFQTSPIARKIIILHLLGEKISVESLLANRNPDGGFGYMEGYPSNIIDTLYALSALDIAGYNQDHIQDKAIRYLLVRQLLSGAFPAQGQLPFFPYPGNNPSFYATCKIVIIFSDKILAGRINKDSLIYTQEIARKSFSK